MNRCRHDIINEMLTALSTEPRRITELCSAGNVPVDRGKDIVLKLERFGLLYEIGEGGGRKYVLTDRGYQWMGLYRFLGKTLP